MAVADLRNCLKNERTMSLEFEFYPEKVCAFWREWGFTSVGFFKGLLD